MPTLDGWRVVDPKGAPVPVRVWVGYCDCGCKQSPTWVQVDGGTTYGVNRDGEAPQRDIRRKIGEAYPCAEIRAPGEMTTAETVDALTAERDRYREVATTSDSDAEREAIAWADRVVALEARVLALRTMLATSRREHDDLRDAEYSSGKPGPVEEYLAEIDAELAALPTETS